MDEHEWLASQFETHRVHLRAVAYRMLGSLSEADDAVQETWLRLHRSDASDIRNLGGWLTTIVARISLNMLSSRRSRREEPLSVYVPDPIVSALGGSDPEHAALLADSIGLALLVVLETLTPAERLAFVLHDMFALPFEEIAPIVERSPAAARQLASRARRRVQGAAPAPDPDLTRQREIVDAWISASRGGDFEALVALLDPNVVLRVDGGVTTPGVSKLVQGATTVANQALSFQRLARFVRPVLVNGTPGLITVPDGKPMAVTGFTITHGKIVAIDILADRERLSRLDLTGHSSSNE